MILWIFKKELNDVFVDMRYCSDPDSSSRAGRDPAEDRDSYSPTSKGPRRNSAPFPGRSREARRGADREAGTCYRGEARE